MLHHGLPESFWEGSQLDTKHCRRGGTTRVVLVVPPPPSPPMVAMSVISSTPLKGTGGGVTPRNFCWVEDTSRIDQGRPNRWEGVKPAKC